MNSPGSPDLRVSIGILCFNQSDLIGLVIESAQKQSRRAEEILVVDDGSTDGSHAVIRSYAGVRLVAHETNRGRAAARTTVLTEATGDIVVYLDGDTTADTDLLANLLEEYGPDVGAVGAIVEECIIATVYDRWRAKHGTNQHIQEPNRDASRLYGWGLSCRRELALALGGLRPGSEDLDLTLRIRKSGARLVLTPRARVYHLRTDDRKALQSMVYRWAFGGYVTFARSGDDRVRPHLARVMRRLRARIVEDVVRCRDLPLAAVSILIVPSEVLGVIQAQRYLRTGRVHPRRIRGF